MKRIDQQLFREVKHSLRNRLTTARNLAKRYDLSLKTIYQIRGSKDFVEYTQQNKAQHPDVKFSLKEEILWLHDLTFRKDNSYIAPLTARQAIRELQDNV